MRLLWILLLSVMASGADWPRFRGPNGSGVGEAANLPAEIGPAKNVAWKTSVPFGRSSPVVAGGRVFLTAAEGDTLLTLAYDAATGKELWRRDVKRTHAHKVYKANDAASPTPAADGKSLYVFFPDFGLVSYGYDGKERWRHPLGPFENFYGMSSSPVVAGDLVVLLCDQLRGSFLLAVDRATGRQKWKTAREGYTEGWSVPVVYQDQVVTLGSARVDSYFLATGERRWFLPVSSYGAMGTPMFHGESLIVTTLGGDQPWMPTFAAATAKLDKDGDGKVTLAEAKGEDWEEHFGWVDSNHDGKLDLGEWDTARMYGIGDFGVISVPMNGKGQLESSAIRWRFKRSVSYVSAPVIYDGVFYMVKDGGIITSLDPATGAMHKQGRSPDAPGQYFASPVGAGGKVFLLSEPGKATVLKAGPQWEVLSVNDLGEECYATPAVSGDRLFVRTRGTLYAFGAEAK